MTRTMNSQALVLLDQMLGLSGPGGEQYTTLDDGNVQQVIEISEIARRSLTPAGTAGIYSAICKNRAEGAAGLNDNVVDPYDLADSFTVDQDTNAWPTPVPRGFDVWLIDASVWTETNPSRVDWMELDLTVPSNHQAFFVTRDSMGTPDQGTNDLTHQGLVRWDTALDDDTVTGAATVIRWATENGTINASINKRIRRGTTINFKSHTNAQYVDCYVGLTLGLFPEGLGQDVVT